MFVYECGTHQERNRAASISGARNKYILLVTFTLSFAWTIGAMPIMCSAFIVDNGECMNDTECEKENRTSIVSDVSFGLYVDAYREQRQIRQNIRICWGFRQKSVTFV